MVFTDNVGETLRVPSSVYVGLHTVNFGAGAESESDTVQTTYGLGGMLLSILAAITAWHVVAGKRFSPEARAHFLGWLVGAVIVSVGGVVLWKLLEPAKGNGIVISNICNATLVGIAALVGVQLTKSLWRRIDVERQQ